MTSNKKRNFNVFNRMTLIMVLGLFVLLLITMLLTTALTALIARFWDTTQDNMFVFGTVILAISIVIGVGLSIAYSAIMVRTSKPYLDALQKISECDFSVRIKDGPLMAGLRIAENFNEMAEKLASVETLREDFVSNFSHEFKTPIVSISGFAKLLKDANLTPEERNEYLEVIIDESNRLVRLSESVLMLSRLDSATVVNEKFLLDEQIRQCMLLFANACEAKKIEMDADLESITLENDKRIISQIWVNLLSNAVKFTPEGGKISVSTRCKDNYAVVTVKDNGCGMDEETQKNIFNKFYQGDRSHSTEGNGLGLSVVKKICDLLKIQLEVQSKQGEGSAFTVKIGCSPIIKNNAVAKGGVIRQTNENDATK